MTNPLTVLRGDALTVLRTLEPESVQCCVTSPPYWGLRDYAVDGQLGLEASPREYLRAMLRVFAEVRRVLRKDGTLWLNMGDCYAQTGGPGWQGKNGQRADRRFTAVRDTVGMREIGRRPPQGLKSKDLVGMPWRLAFALQRCGWWLRSDIVWSKPNPMPESVRDRPTRSHEYLFLMTRSARYFYDADGISEPLAASSAPPMKTPAGWDTSKGNGGNGSFHRNGREKGTVREAAAAAAAGSSSTRRREGLNARWDAKERELGEKGAAATDEENRSSAGARMGRGAGWRNDPSTSPLTRNARSVWTIATQPYPEAHFATFPEEIPRRAILAGSRPGDLVLDPFGGSGTTGKVALQLGRRATLIELNAEYVALIEKRCTVNLGLELSA